MSAVLGRLHEIAVLDETGDSKTIWNPSAPDEVDAARETFKTLKKKGYLIYRVGVDGKKAELMHEFDPKAEKMIAAPANVGG